jgi:hypothetical protein
MPDPTITVQDLFEFDLVDALFDFALAAYTKKLTPAHHDRLKALYGDLPRMTSPESELFTEVGNKLASLVASDFALLANDDLRLAAFDRAMDVRRMILKAQVPTHPSLILERVREGRAS